MLRRTIIQHRFASWLAPVRGNRFRLKSVFIGYCNRVLTQPALRWFHSLALRHENFATASSVTPSSMVNRTVTKWLLVRYIPWHCECLGGLAFFNTLQIPSSWIHGRWKTSLMLNLATYST